MKDDELASRIPIPQGPLKRRVLIPGGPTPAAPSAVPVMVSLPSAIDPSVIGGVIPPPSVVVPTLVSNPAGTLNQPQMIIPPAVAVQSSQYPSFFAHHSMATPNTVEPSVSNAISLIANSISEASTATLQQFRVCFVICNLCFINLC